MLSSIRNCTWEKSRRKQALRVLKDDVVLSEAMANQEVERYTFRSPAQATSYFYGYTRLAQLRADTEKAMGARFDPLKFHDFILAQGLLPPRCCAKRFSRSSSEATFPRLGHNPELVRVAERSRLRGPSAGRPAILKSKMRTTVLPAQFGR